jgi:predicted secreted protein
MQEVVLNSINIKVGEHATVELEDNSGSTGYSWVIGHKPDSLWLEGIEYISPASPVVPGKPGKRVFKFFGAEKCNDSIQFILVRIWEPSTAQITTYKVTVN